MNELSRLLRYARPYTPQLIASVILMALAGAAHALTAVLIKPVIDRVLNPATPDAPPQVLDRIKLASAAGSPLAKALDGLFRVRADGVLGGGVLPADEAATVTSGALEGSNVDTAGVLVEMIESQRLFDMRTKLVATARELDQGGASLMRLG